MKTERPLYPAYHAILTQLADQGELACKELGIDARTFRRLQHLLALGYLTHRRDPSAPRLRFIYALTDAGCAALGRGVGPPNPRFTATAPPLKSDITLSVKSCIHHWVIENDLSQTGRCKKCLATKEFRPTFGMELATVGGGRVTASERFPEANCA